MTKRLCYNKDLLQEVCDRDRCIIDFDKIEKYNREIKVSFICNCGCEYSKTFIMLYKIGAFCEKCTKNKRYEKVKKTCIERYGVDNPQQSQKVKDKSKQTCIEKYGVKNPSQSQEVRDKFKQTCIDKYGVENPSQSQEVRDKFKQTCIDKYGVKNPSQTQEVRDKFKQTCIKKYGVEHSSQSQEVKNKSKQTCIKKYGVEHQFQSQEVIDKSKQTCIKKYGVEYHMQNAISSEKALQKSYNLKEFNFPCGNSIQVQGYEPFLLKNLVEEGYTYEDIITKRSETPVIWYENNNKKHRYYCDIYIPKINTIYEVKSIYTNDVAKEKISLTKQACIDAGYLFELYVYDKKGIRQEDL
jgi:hypothetical protein